jgi:protein-S-isoprenylcysteine O-methyltransferase Ste14
VEQRSPSLATSTAPSRRSFLSTDRRTGKKSALALGAAVAALALLIVTGLLLREYAPGNVGGGSLQGAAVGLVGVGVVVWRVSKRPRSATTLERA